MTLVPLEQTYTVNDTYTEIPPADADGFSNAVITVSVPSPLPIVIDRVAWGRYDPIRLNQFTSTTAANITVPQGRTIIAISYSDGVVPPSWSIRMLSNDGTSPASLMVQPGYYYIFTNTNIYYATFRDSSNVVYFTYGDYSNTDKNGTQISFWDGLFRFDFSS